MKRICLIMAVSLNTGHILTASSHQPFYSVWVSAAKSKSGFHNDDIYISTQWSKLNKKTYYLISAGEYQSKYKSKESKKAFKNTYIRCLLSISGEKIKQ